jgi:hypothetical protein
MAGKKKFNLEEKAISEILVADTILESGAEASDVENDFEEKEGKEEEENNNNNKPQQKLKQTNHRLQISGGLPTWGMRQELNTNTYLFLVQQKV